MNLKRKTKMLTCCLIIMGMLSIGVLSTQAAVCTHPRYKVNYDDVQDSYINANGHYQVRGTQYVCSCGYSYWENLHTVKTNHQWEILSIDMNGNPVYSDCTICGWKK